MRKRSKKASFSSICFKIPVFLVALAFMQNGEAQQSPTNTSGATSAPTTAAVTPTGEPGLETIPVVVGIYKDVTTVVNGQSQIQQSLDSAFLQGEGVERTARFQLRQFSDVQEIFDAAPDLDAIVTLSSCSVAHRIANNVTDDGVLHVAYTAGWCPRHDSPLGMIIPVLDQDQNLLQLLTDMRLADTLTWRSITIIHDDSIAPSMVEQVVNVLVRGIPQYKDSLISVFSIPKSDTASTRRGQIYDVLKPIQKVASEANYLVMMREDGVKSTMNVARTLGLNGLTNQWLYVMPDTDITKFKLFEFLDEVRDGDNIAFLYNMASNSLVPDCKESLDCLVQSVFKNYFVETEKTVTTEVETKNFIPEEEWEEIKPTKAVRNTKIAGSIRSSILARNDTGGASSCFGCSRWGAHAVEITGPNTSRLISTLEWRPLLGLELKDDLFPHIFGGMRGRQIAVTSVHYPPWTVFVRDGSGNVVDYKGFMFEVLDEIGRQMNFTYAVAQPADGKWGVRDKNGNWNGMIELIRKGEAMLAVASMVVTEERRQAVSFTDTIDRQPYAFMYERPKELSRALIFVEPFTPKVWIFIFIMTIVIGPLLWAMTKINPYYTYHGYRTDRGLFRLGNCIWYSFGAVLQQGGIHLPDAISGRLLVGTWWLFVLVIVTSYSGNLVAFLTFPKTENPLNSLDTLVNSAGSISWGATSGTYLETYLSESTVPLHQQLRKGLILHETAGELLLDQIRRGTHVFMDWETNLLFIMKESYNKTGVCDFSLSKEKFFEELVAMPIQKNNIYLPRFNAQIRRVLEVGLTRKWKQIYWPKEDECSSTAEGGDDQNRTVNVSDMQGSFYVLLLGFIVGLCLMFGECFFGRRGQAIKERLSGTTKKLTGGKDVIYPFVS